MIDLGIKHKEVTPEHIGELWLRNTPKARSSVG
jgi:hypothetical protein